MLRNLRQLTLSAAVSCVLSIPVYADITINPGEEFYNSGFLDNLDYIDNYGYLRNDGTINNFSYSFPFTSTQLNNWGTTDNYAQMYFMGNASLNNFGDFYNNGDVTTDFYYPNVSTFTNTGTLYNFSNFSMNISNRGVIHNDGYVASNSILNQVTGIIENNVAGFLNIFENLMNSGAFNNDGGLQIQNNNSQGVTITNAGTLNNSGYIEARSYAGEGGINIINSGQLMNTGNMYLNASNLNINNTGIFTNYGNIENYSSDANIVFNNAGQMNNFSSFISDAMIITNSGGIENNSSMAVNGLNNLGTGMLNNLSGGYLYVGNLINEGVINNDGFISIFNGYGYDQRAVLTNSSIFNNRGTLFLEYNSQAIINNFGVFNQQGIIENQSDNIVINNYGSFDDSMGWGEFNLRNNSSLNNYGVYNNWNGLNGAGSSILFNAGTFSSPGQIREMWLIRNSGIMSLGSDVNTMNLNNTSSGVINNDGWAGSWFNGLNVLGEFRNQGTINNGNGSRLNLNGYAVATNSGTINNSESAEIHSNSDLNNSGTINNSRNALVNLSGMTNTNAGTINNDGVINAYMGLNSSGIIAGNGEYYVSSGMYGLEITEAGTLAPGKSLEDMYNFGDVAMDIFGDVILNGTLAMDFDWMGYGGMHDVVNVYGNVVLGADSVLDISFLGDNYFSLGQSFDLMFANDIIGDFGGFYYDALFDNGLALQWEIFSDFGQDILRVSVVTAVPLPAAAWLFISGMIGLFGVARRKKSILH